MVTFVIITVGYYVETNGLATGRTAATPTARVHHNAGDVAKRGTVLGRGRRRRWWGFVGRWHGPGWKRFLLATGGDVESSFLWR